MPPPRGPTEHCALWQRLEWHALGHSIDSRMIFSLTIAALSSSVNCSLRTHFKAYLKSTTLPNSDATLRWDKQHAIHRAARGVGVADAEILKVCEQQPPSAISVQFSRNAKATIATPASARCAGNNDWLLSRNEEPHAHAGLYGATDGTNNHD